MKCTAIAAARAGAAALFLAASSLVGLAGEPALLSEIPLPPTRENPQSNIDPQPDHPSLALNRGRGVPGAAETAEKSTGTPGEKRNRLWPFRKAARPETAPAKPMEAPTAPVASASVASMDETSEDEYPASGGAPSAPAEPPAPEAVDAYRAKLETRLLERYNNLPEHAGRVAAVRVILSRPLEISLDGKMIRAEFDQLVYDAWGGRLPALEREYYVVIFGSGGAAQVRAEPSVRIGLDLEKTYSERAPLAADPFRNVGESEAFRPAPKAKMPSWWRPDFPEAGR